MKLGETRAYSPQDLIGKSLKVNLMALTNDPKTQSVTLRFKIVEASQTNCVTDLVDYVINNAHIKRLVRKASNKLEDSFLVKTIVCHLYQTESYDYDLLIEVTL